MIHGENAKYVKLLTTAAVGTTEATGSCDCLGFDHAAIIFTIGTHANAQLTTLSLAEGEVTNSFTAIAAFELGASNNGTAFPAANDSADNYIVYDVDLRSRKRYLQIGIAAAASKTCACVAVLTRAESTPTSITEAGVAAYVKG